MKPVVPHIKTTIAIKALIILMLFPLMSAYAQVPQGFKYQAVARDNIGNLLQNQNLSIRISLIDSANNGNQTYREIHKTGTNQFGLFSVTIGEGIDTIGSFIATPWANGNIWLKIEMDPIGGTNYTLMSLSQLISVPYALMAGAAVNVDDADANPANEFNTGFSFDTSSNELILTDDGGILAVDLGSLIDDADADPANEYNTSANLTGNTINIVDGGGATSVDLSPLFHEHVETKSIWTLSYDSIVNSNWIKIYSINLNGVLRIENPGTISIRYAYSINNATPVQGNVAAASFIDITGIIASTIDIMVSRYSITTDHLFLHFAGMSAVGHIRGKVIWDE